MGFTWVPRACFRPRMCGCWSDREAEHDGEHGGNRAEGNSMRMTVCMMMSMSRDTTSIW